jgi:ligand-binding SRPBCC domain-containing protein
MAGKRLHKTNMKEHLYNSELWLARSPAEIFPFFADAKNLATVTPPWLHFEILTPGHIEMGVGTLIDYRISLHGIPLRWRTKITAWEPPFRFVDEQIKAPTGAGFTNTVSPQVVRALSAMIKSATRF